MKRSDIPSKFPIPFGNSAGAGYIRQVPTASQIGVTNGAASLTDGFVPLNFLPVGSGGVPPFGQDMNGILNQISAWSRWQSAGNPLTFDATFATNIGGYPAGAILSAAAGGNLWLCLTDDNTSNPDTGGAGWVAIGVGRTRLYANLNLYVATTGSDSNNGFSAGSPFATLQKAWDYLQSSVDLNGFSVTINVADGTYTAGILGQGSIVGQNTASAVTFQGNATTPANCVVNVTNSNSFATLTGAFFTVNGFTMTATGSASAATGCALRTNQGTIIFQNCRFGACSVAHLSAGGGGAIFTNGANTIFGGAPNAWFAAVSGNINVANSSWTLTGTPAFSGSFVAAQTSSTVLAASVSFSGSATGQRYNAIQSSTINSFGSGANYFPGSIAGSADSTSTYA